MKSLLKQIIITIKQHDPFTCNIVESLDENIDENPYLGYDGEKKLMELNLSETETNVIKVRCRRIAVKLVTERGLKVSKNVKILEKMSVFFCYKCIEYNQKTH